MISLERNSTLHVLLPFLAHHYSCIPVHLCLEIPESHFPRKNALLLADILSCELNKKTIPALRHMVLWRNVQRQVICLSTPKMKMLCDVTKKQPLKTYLMWNIGSLKWIWGYLMLYHIWFNKVIAKMNPTKHWFDLTKDFKHKTVFFV